MDVKTFPFLILSLSHLNLWRVLLEEHKGRHGKASYRSVRPPSTQVPGELERYTSVLQKVFGPEKGPLSANISNIFNQILI